MARHCFSSGGTFAKSLREDLKSISEELVSKDSLVMLLSRQRKTLLHNRPDKPLVKLQHLRILST